jgi:hypothetical protein
LASPLSLGWAWIAHRPSRCKSRALKEEFFGHFERRRVAPERLHPCPDLPCLPPAAARCVGFAPVPAGDAILAIPTLVARVYGMNFAHMPELSWTYGYPPRDDHRWPALPGVPQQRWPLTGDTPAQPGPSGHRGCRGPTPSGDDGYDITSHTAL